MSAGPVLVEWERDGETVTEWYCDPPPIGREYLVIRCAWAHDVIAYEGAVRVRRIFEIELAPEWLVRPAGE